MGGIPLQVATHLTMMDVDDTDAQKIALTELCKYERETAFPIALDVHAPGMVKYAKDLIQHWSIDAKCLLDLASCTKNSNTMRHHALSFMRREGLLSNSTYEQNTLIGMAYSDESMKVREESLKVLASESDLSQEVLAKIKPLAYPWRGTTDGKHAITLHMIYTAQYIVGYPSLASLIAVPVATAGLVYAAWSGVQAIGAETFPAALCDITPWKSLISVCMGFVAYGGLTIDSERIDYARKVRSVDCL